MSIEKAIQKCVDKINMSGGDESADIYEYMYRYKAIRELPEEKQEEVYDEIAARLGF